MVQSNALQLLVTHTFFLIFVNTIFFQGDIGPFVAGLPIDVPLWMAINLKQRQKARIRPPEWMDVGTLFQVIKNLTELSGSF